MAKKPPAFLLDASALLAYLQKEPGFEAVREALREGAGISAVNLAEVVGKLKAKGKEPDRILRRLLAMGLEVLPFTLEEALEAGALDPLTRPLGLSLGDRACLAAGKVRRLPVPHHRPQLARGGARGRGADGALGPGGLEDPHPGEEGLQVGPALGDRSPPDLAHEPRGEGLPLDPHPGPGVAPGVVLHHHGPSRVNQTPSDSSTGWSGLPGETGPRGEGGGGALEGGPAGEKPPGEGGQAPGGPPFPLCLGGPLGLASPEELPGLPPAPALPPPPPEARPREGPGEAPGAPGSQVGPQGVRGLRRSQAQGQAEGGPGPRPEVAGHPPLPQGGPPQGEGGLLDGDEEPGGAGVGGGVRKDDCGYRGLPASRGPEAEGGNGA